MAQWPCHDAHDKDILLLLFRLVAQQCRLLLEDKRRLMQSSCPTGAQGQSSYWPWLCQQKSGHLTAACQSALCRWRSCLLSGSFPSYRRAQLVWELCFTRGSLVVWRREIGQDIKKILQDNFRRNMCSKCKHSGVRANVCPAPKTYRSGIQLWVPQHPWRTDLVDSFFENMGAGTPTTYRSGFITRLLLIYSVCQQIHTIFGRKMTLPFIDKVIKFQEWGSKIDNVT